MPRLSILKYSTVDAKFESTFKLSSFRVCSKLNQLKPQPLSINLTDEPVYWEARDREPDRKRISVLLWREQSTQILTQFQTFTEMNKTWFLFSIKMRILHWKWIHFIFVCNLRVYNFICPNTSDVLSLILMTICSVKK